MKFSISTVIVVVLALGLLLVGIMDVVGMVHFKKMFPFLAFSRYFDIPSLFIVMGGLLTNTSIMFSPQVVAQAFKRVGFLFSHSAYTEKKQYETVQTVASWVNPYNQNRVAFINDNIDKLKGTAAGYFIGLLSANYTKDEFAEIANKYIHQSYVENKKLSDVFQSMGNSGPAFGMFGTLFGLVYMLSSMDDPSKIGPGLALGLLVTLYGVSLTHLLFFPLAKKLKIAADKERLNEELMVEGIYLMLERKTEIFIKDSLESQIERKFMQKLQLKK